MSQDMLHKFQLFDLIEPDDIELDPTGTAIVSPD